MRQLVATLRRRPGPLAGTFVALFVAAVVVTMTATLARTGQTLKPPVQRLAGATAVLTGNPKVKVVEGHDADTLAITGYRRLPVSIAPSLAAVKGVSQAIPDLSIPLALQQPGRPAVTGSSANPLSGHGWASTALTPFTLRSGHAPRTLQPDRRRGRCCGEREAGHRQRGVARGPRGSAVRGRRRRRLPGKPGPGLDGLLL